MLIVDYRAYLNVNGIARQYYKLPADGREMNVRRSSSPLSSVSLTSRATATVITAQDMETHGWGAVP